MIVKFITLFIFIHHEVFPVKKKPNFFMFPEGFFPSLGSWARSAKLSASRRSALNKAKVAQFKRDVPNGAPLFLFLCLAKMN